MPPATLRPAIAKAAAVHMVENLGTPMDHHSLAALKLPCPRSQCGRAKYRRGNMLLSEKPQWAGAEAFYFLAGAPRGESHSFHSIGWSNRVSPTRMAVAGATFLQMETSDGIVLRAAKFLVHRTQHSIEK
jgi:hypothetical protein